MIALARDAAPAATDLPDPTLDPFDAASAEHATEQPEGGALRGARAWQWLVGSVAFWSAIAALFGVQAILRGHAGPSLVRLFVGGFVSFVPCMLLAPAIAALGFRYRFTGAAMRRAWVAHLAGLVGFVVVGGGMMGALDWLLPWAPRGEGIVAAAGASVVRFLAIDVMIFTLIAAAVQAFASAQEARERSVAAARLQAQLAEARLHVLTSQLQPHFLFNTLHAISALVRESPIEAERMLVRLSELLRQALHSGMRGETSLEQELGFLEKYVEVQEMRFGPRLAVTFEVDPRLLGVRVPSLLLQPLVENAIRHGIAGRPGPGTVRVDARREGERVRLTVTDDGVGLPRTGPTREGIGLRTTRARLRQLYGDDHQFALASPPTGGTVCTVVLPVRETTGARA